MKTVEKSAWVAKGLEKLGDSGVDTVKVEVLARELGVTKGSFYWHFTDRSALLDALLEHWEQASALDYFNRVEGAEGETAATQLERIFSMAFAADGALERALRAWAAHEERAAAVLKRVDARRLKSIAKLMKAHGLEPTDCDARSRMLYAAFIGEQQLTVALAAKRRVTMALSAIDALLR